MFSLLLTASTMLAAASALATPARQSLPRRELGLPANGIVSNGVAFGFLPSDGYDVISPDYTMADLNAKLGAKASTYGWYSQITSTTYNGDQLLEVLDDVVASGAVFQPAVMPSINFDQIDSNVASQVISVLEKFTSQGVEVWLRFGHEMNYYVTDGQYSGTPAAFITAWKNLHAAAASNDLIKMYWSPNVDSSSEPVAPYWPGPSYVDIVGIDCYPDATANLPSNQFSLCYSSFYQTYAAAHNIPFAIGETAYSGPSGNDAWLAQLVGQNMCDYPLYIAASWFEYNQGSTDYLIVEGSSALLAKTKSLLLHNTGTGTTNCTGSSTGTGTGIGTGSGSGSGYPADTCTWGCEGWDCSSSSPCQSAYSCVSGICGACTWGCSGWSCSSSSPCNADYTCVSGYCHHSGAATK